MKELILERDRLITKRKKIHAGYHEVPPTNHAANKEKRAQIREEVLTLSKEIRPIMQAIRHYDEHHELPEGFVKKGSKEDLQKRYNNLKSQKSKCKAKVKGTRTKNPLPPGPKKEEAKAKLKEIQAEMQNLKKLLNE